MKSDSTNPEAHSGHRIGVDQWAKDFGGRRVPGNAYCFDCGVPVAASIEPEPEEKAP